jgi:hypothetical protein
MSTLLTYDQDYNVTAHSGRIEIGKRGLKIMAENPIFVVGINGFTIAEGLSHKDVGGKWSTAHNSFIQIGAELGVMGLFLFCYIIWTSLKGIKKVLKSVSQGKKGISNTNYPSRNPVFLDWVWHRWVFPVCRSLSFVFSISGIVNSVTLFR